MTRETYEEWIADENASEVIQKFDEGSAVEVLGTPVVMNTEVKNIPRDGGFTVGNVAKAADYGQSTADKDTVELILRKTGGIEVIAAEDLVDTFVGDPLAIKRRAAARALAIDYDNSSIAVTGAQNLGAGRKFVSAYYTLRHNGTGTVDASYVADDNYTSVTKANFIAALASGTGYNVLNDAIGDYEEGDYFDEGDTVVIAHPIFKRLLRGVKDASGNPMLVPRDGGEIKIGGYNLFGYSTSWSKGARTSATDTDKPSGNPLLLVCNRAFLARGVGSMPGIPAGGVGFALQSPQNGAGFDNDTFRMKAAVRRGFRLTMPFAASLIEVTGV